MSTRMRDLLDEALGHLRYEPTEQRVRAHARHRDRRRQHARAARLGAAARRAVLRRPEARHPRRAPPGAATDDDAPGVLHPGIPFAVHTAAGEPVTIGGRRRRVPARRRRARRARRARLLRLRRVVRGGRADPRPPARPVLPRRRPPDLAAVRIELDGEVAGRDHPRAAALRDAGSRRASTSRARTSCVALQPERPAHLLPVQGRGVLLVVEAGGQRENLAWSYEDPLPDAAAITGLVAFWDERVDVFVDGVPRPRPGGAVSEAMQDEFGAECQRASRSSVAWTRPASRRSRASGSSASTWSSTENAVRVQPLRHVGADDRQRLVGAIARRYGRSDVSAS